MPQSPSPDELNERFGIDGSLKFDRGRGDLVRAVATAGGNMGTVYLHGAHVTDYRPAGHEPVLFLSEAAVFADGEPIRGGVPVCFPWFAVKASDPGAPNHGLVRTKGWTVSATGATDEGIVVELATTADRFTIAHRVTIGRRLTMTLAVTNSSDSAARFEQALHTYFAVPDVTRIAIDGLGGARYISDLEGEHTQPAEPIRFAGEIDRLYLDTASTCVIHDDGLGRRIRVGKSNSSSTVIWNPWVDKSRRMDDFGNDEWRRMVCIETANAGENAVSLPSGETHEMTAVVSAERDI